MLIFILNLAYVNVKHKKNLLKKLNKKYLNSDKLIK